MLFSIPKAVLVETFSIFRSCGNGLRECQVLWTSSWEDPQKITNVVHPAHRAHAGGFVLESAWLNRFWFELAKRNQGIRVQVHTHPGEAFHSETDDLYPIVHTPGFLSLVIPDFATGRVGLSKAFLTELDSQGQFQEVSPSARMKITP